MPEPQPKTRNAVTEVGLFASESLFVSFDFTKDEFLAASQRYQEALTAQRPIEMPSELKTYVHELTHYVQYTTTPYGLFLQYCRKMQSRATAAIVTELLNAGIPFNMPLLENLPDVTGKTEAGVNWGLSIWLNVENLVSMMHGDTQRRIELWKAFEADEARVRAGQRPKRPPLMDVHEAFVRTQESMADYLERVNAEAKAMGSTIPVGPEGFDREALRQEKTAFPSQFTRNLVGSEFALEMFGNPWNVEAIIESAATAAEFWGSPMDWDSFVAWMKSNVDPKLQVYRVCLEDGLHSISTRSVREFILSYISICELALFSPVLPHHASLRKATDDFGQILPVARWKMLLSAASKIRPMIDLGDHDRYVLELCRDLGWVHPMQMISMTMNGPDSFLDPLASIYVWAQKWRAQSGTSFIGLNRFLFDPSLRGETWRNMFNFVILDYADRTNYHRDKDFLEAMTTRELERLGMRCIMMGKNLVMSAPYRGDQAERTWMTEWLRASFKTAFGRDFPSLRFV